MMTTSVARVGRVLVTGGAGFIGSSVIRRLLKETASIVFNLDKMGYASDLISIESLQPGERHHLLQVDLANLDATVAAVQQADPDFVMHLAAESHVDRSIDGPGEFLASNVIGTFNLLQAVRMHWDSLPAERQEHFRFHHISTDEVFGSLGDEGYFSETTAYDPRSPYSATKAASDHLVSAWHHTYGLPVVLTNCSNNYGPWQFPEKLIPVVIRNALAGKSIPLYGDGSNVRDWLFVEDHVDALLLVANRGEVGMKYCIGGNEQRTNHDVVTHICQLLDVLCPREQPYGNLITPVADRLGHDLRYAIDASLIGEQLGWKPRHSFSQGLAMTVDWYINNLDWCQRVSALSGFQGQRLGLGGDK